MKMVFVTWLVLPQLRGASFVYEELVKGKLKKYFRNLGSDSLLRQKVTYFLFVEPSVRVSFEDGFNDSKNIFCRWKTRSEGEERIRSTYMSIYNLIVLMSQK